MEKSFCFLFIFHQMKSYSIFPSSHHETSFHIFIRNILNLFEIFNIFFLKLKVILMNIFVGTDKTLPESFPSSREINDNKAKCVWPRFTSIRIFGSLYVAWKLYNYVRAMKRSEGKNFHEKFCWHCAYSVAQNQYFCLKVALGSQRKSETKQQQQHQSIGVYVFYAGKIYGLCYTLFSTQPCIKKCCLDIHIHRCNVAIYYRRC